MGAGTPKSVMSSGVMIEPPPTPVRPTTMPTPKPVTASRPKSPSPVTGPVRLETAHTRGVGAPMRGKQRRACASPELRADEDQRRAGHSGVLEFSQGDERGVDDARIGERRALDNRYR